MSAVREGAGVYDASDHAVIRIEGPDAAEFLHSLTTNNVRELSVGELQYSALLDRRGKVLSLFALLRAAENHFQIIVQTDLIEWTINHLTKMRFMQKVELSDVSAAWGLLWVVGPRALAVVSEALAIPADQMTEPNQLMIPADKPSWQLWQDQRWAAQKVNVLLPLNEAAETLSRLQAAGAITVAKEVLDLIRLENEIPEYGLEIDGQHILLEANLADSFSRAKGCYPGQEVVERICAYGDGKTPTQLKVFFVKGAETLEKDTAVFCGETQAGTVMRSLYDPSRDETLVAAYIAAKFLDQIGPGQVRDGKVYLEGV